MTTFAGRWSTHPVQFWLRGERPEQSVSFDEPTGLWQVHGHAEAHEILGDPRTYSSDTNRVHPELVPESLREGDLTTMDPPGHRKLRQLVSRAFTPKLVADLEPRINGLTRELLDATAGKESIELVADLAYPLPVTVIADMLGVPSSDQHLFKQWADAMILGKEKAMQAGLGENQDPELVQQLTDQVAGGMQPMLDYLRDHAEERRRRPREDLLTKLVQAEIDGERLSDNEVVNFANLLLLAGHLTTTLVLGNTVLCLDAFADQQARVREDRTLVPAAIEESVRFLTPFAVLARVTTTDVVLGGQRIPADRMMMVWVGAANRDPRAFDRPDVFDVSRDPNPHLGFGRGIHFCLGAPLARLEARVALNLLLDKFPALRTDPDHPPAFMSSMDMTGVRSLPLPTG